MKLTEFPGYKRQKRRMLRNFNRMRETVCVKCGMRGDSILHVYGNFFLREERIPGKPPVLAGLCPGCAIKIGDFPTVDEILRQKCAEGRKA